MEDIAGYEIICEIDAIGKEKRFKAKYRDLDKTAVLSVVDENFFPTEDFIIFFKQLAIDARRLDHPNVVSIFELGRSKHFFYIASEYVGYLTVGNFLKQAGMSGQAVPFQVCLFLLEQTVIALREAHEKEIFHGCLNAENIMICFDGSVKISGFTDFNRFFRKEELNKKFDLNSLKVFTRQIFCYSVPVNPCKTVHDLFAKITDDKTYYSCTEGFICDIERLKKESGFSGDQDELKNIVQKVLAPQQFCPGNILKKELTSGTSEKKYPADRRPVIFLCFAAIVFFGSLFFLSGKSEEKTVLPCSPLSQFSSNKTYKQNIPENKTKILNSMTKQNIPILPNKQTGCSKVHSGFDTAVLVFISVQPQNAKIFFDGLFVGEGDKVIKNVPEGKHVLKITHPEYEDENRIINAGKVKKIRLIYRNGEITEEKNADL